MGVFKANNEKEKFLHIFEIRSFASFKRKLKGRDKPRMIDLK
jgi:hypothetical protein